METDKNYLTLTRFAEVWEREGNAGNPFPSQERSNSDLSAQVMVYSCSFPEKEEGMEEKTSHQQEKKAIYSAVKPANSPEPRAQKPACHICTAKADVGGRRQKRGINQAQGLEWKSCEGTGYFSRMPSLLQAGEHQAGSALPIITANHC